MVTRRAGPPTRVLALGFDAGNPGLLERWAADGTLPNLRALMERGQVGASRSVEGFLVGATWPSFFTGVTPARHGFHYITQLRPGSYEYEQATPRRPAFWTHLSHAGKRAAVFDVPMSVLDPEINGMQIVDWGAIETWARFECTPPELRGRIRSEWGEHPLRYRGDDLRRTAAEHRVLLDQLCRGTQLRAEMATRYLNEGGWDFFIQVFSEPHCAGHNAWHLHDPTHPSHDPSIAAALGDPLRRIYQEVDAAMGRLIEAAGDATIFVFTPHGMSYWYSAQFILSEILVRLGVAQPSQPPPAPTGPVWRSAAIAGARAAWRLVPPSIRRYTFELRQRLQSAPQGMPLPSIEVDPTRSRCFMVRNGHLTGAIRLNLAGREPFGMVAPGAEADAFVRQLTSDLLEIVDERTGRPLIQGIRRTRDYYDGEHLDALPDLLVDWADELPTGNSNIGGGAAATVRARSPKIGMVEGTNDFSRTGDHRIGGLFIAAGPGIRPGRLGREVSVMDFAPTLCRMLGVDLPDVDGRPILDLLPPGTT